MYSGHCISRSPLPVWIRTRGFHINNTPASFKGPTTEYRHSTCVRFEGGASVTHLPLSGQSVVLVLSKSRQAGDDLRRQEVIRVRHRVTDKFLLSARVVIVLQQSPALDV